MQSEQGYDYTGEYIRQRRRLQSSWGDAVISSDEARAKDAGVRRYWSSILLVRICLIGRSLLRLCPDFDNQDPLMHWDFASAGTIARSVFECGLFFRYFTTDVEAQEWRARQNIMQLADCTERINLFSMLNNLEEVSGFQAHAEDLRQRLLGNSYFQTLESKLQKTLLQGARASIYTLRQLADEYIRDDSVWFFYQSTSSNTHSLPFSFYRMTEHGRIGVENDVEKHYFAMAMSVAADIIDGVVAAFREDFAPLVVFSQIGTAPSERLLTMSNPSVAVSPRINRDALCPCGSKQKFRWCHGL